jgi:integrase
MLVGSETKTPKARRTLEDIQEYYSPETILKVLWKRAGWNYQSNEDYFRLRDRALVCVLYLCALRVSEALRLKKSQFRIEEERQRVKVVGILLSKRKEYSIVKYREAWLPLSSGSLLTPRQKMTSTILEYLDRLAGDDDLLFHFGRSRAWQIVHSMSPDFWPHLFRAFGENFLYDAWDHDMLAVSDYVKVNPRTLEKYIRRSYEKYRPV